MFESVRGQVTTGGGGGGGVKNEAVWLSTLAANAGGQSIVETMSKSCRACVDLMCYMRCHGVR